MIYAASPLRALTRHTVRALASAVLVKRTSLPAGNRSTTRECPIHPSAARATAIATSCVEGTRTPTISQALAINATTAGAITIGTAFLIRAACVEAVLAIDALTLHTVATTEVVGTIAVCLGRACLVATRNAQELSGKGSSYGCAHRAAVRAAVCVHCTN